MIAAVRLAAVATVTAVGIALALATQVSPASAAEQPAGALLSLDGSNFSGAPAGSLFPAGVVLIPGATAEATFWVRNESGAPADLRIAVSDTTATAAAFVESLTLQAATPATAAEAPVPLSGGDCTPLLTGEVLAPGATTQVHIVLAMSPDAGNGGQGASAAARIAVSLAEVTPGASLPPNCEATTGVPLLPSSATPAVSSSASAADAATAADTTAASAPESPAGAAAEGDALALPTLSLGDQPAVLPGLLAALGGIIFGTALLVRRRRAR